VHTFKYSKWRRLPHCQFCRSLCAWPAPCKLSFDNHHDQLSHCNFCGPCNCSFSYHDHCIPLRATSCKLRVCQGQSCGDQMIGPMTQPFFGTDHCHTCCHLHPEVVQCQQLELLLVTWLPVWTYSHQCKMHQESAMPQG
jgi:hypothetical protein